MTIYKTFRGVGAAIRSLSGSTADVVLFSDKDTLDLPSAKGISYQESDMVGKTSWPQVKYDARGLTKTGAPLPPVLSPKDIAGLGITTVGPLKNLPYAQYLGGLYVEDKQFDAWVADGTISLADWQKVCTPSYAFRSLVYAPDATNGAYANRRYAGFHARVLSRDGSVLIVKITQDSAETGELRFDLKDPSHCTLEGPVESGETLLGDSSQKGEEGALYIERFRAGDLVLRGPKLPPGMG